MNINYMDYSPATDSLDIFVSGCAGKPCKGCCNPEILDFNAGTDWNKWLPQLAKYLAKPFCNMFSRIFLVGGSPNHQDPKDLKKLMYFLKLYNKEIWLYAREDLDHIQPIFIENCDYIKCGEYKPELACTGNVQYGIDLATSNQRIYKKGKDY